MPNTLTPTTTAADYPTLVPPEPDEHASPWDSWIPVPEYWNAAPTVLLPSAKPEPPVPIPEGVYLIPTDMLPPPMLDLAPREPSSIPPPPMVGPIEVAPASVRAAPLAPAEPQPAPPSAPATSTDAPPLPIDEFPLQRCAAIAATMAMQPGNKSAILQNHHLEAATWEALEKHWLAAIRAGLDDGDPGLLRAYDAAFVASLERQRGGPITRAEHASIAAARGRGADALAVLGLPKCAAMAIERVMLQRACSSA